MWVLGLRNESGQEGRTFLGLVLLPKTLRLPARQARFLAKFCENRRGMYAGHVSTTWK